MIASVNYVVIRLILVVNKILIVPIEQHIDQPIILSPSRIVVRRVVTLADLRCPETLKRFTPRRIRGYSNDLMELSIKK